MSLNFPYKVSKAQQFHELPSGVVQGGVPGEPVQRNQGDGGVCGGIRLQAALQVISHVLSRYTNSIKGTVQRDGSGRGPLSTQWANAQ
jgi:hypothetical protein